MKKTNSIKKSVRSNKVIIVLVSIVAVCLLLLGYGFYVYFYAGNNKTKYGDRLDGIEKHQISNKLKDDIKKVYTEDKKVGEINTTLEGKIIYITIDFVDTISASEAKDAAIKSLEALSEDTLSFYDIQYILTSSFETKEIEEAKKAAENNKEEENEDEEEETTKAVFPIFGSKNSSSKRVVW